MNYFRNEKCDNAKVIFAEQGGVLLCLRTRMAIPGCDREVVWYAGGSPRSERQRRSDDGRISQDPSEKVCGPARSERLFNNNVMYG